MPSADDVAHVLIAAARAVGVDPPSVINRAHLELRTSKTHHARVYAGMALREAFKGHRPEVIARLTGTMHERGFFESIDMNLRNGLYDWYSRERYEQVLEVAKARRAA